MIEIYLLEQLDAFHRCGTLSAAAEELHLAQPSLSRSMQKLEDELGVKLFDRQKNKLQLNATGILAAQYAARILSDEAEMEKSIISFDKNLRSISIGSCAPGPLMKLLPQAVNHFSDYTVYSSTEKEEDLIKGLNNDTYQLIVLPHPLKEPVYFCKKYITEHLNASVNPFHPAATYHSITFKEMDGQSFIQLANVGIWEDIVKKKMPHIKLLKQDDLESLDLLAESSNLPMFSTDISITEIPSRSRNRVNIPFSDPEAEVTFYVIGCKKNEKRFESFLISFTNLNVSRRK
jgi:DNA-binding transcriptional LysR family regulator